MSETLTGCTAASTDSTSRSTKVPVEISSVRPEPGKIALKAPRRTKPPKHIADFDMAGRREFLKELGYQPFRASQLSKHYFERLVNDPAQMTDLPAQDRDEMVSRAMPQLLTPVRTLEADGGDTLKVVHRLFDGALIESVIMRYDNRVTMCISSQAGCGMNCPFCATGQQGLTRNLSTAEIVEQVVAGARYLKQMKGLDKADGGSEDTRPLRVSNIVFMGMGEALANYKSTMGAVHRLIDPAPEGLGISRADLRCLPWVWCPVSASLSWRNCRLRLPSRCTRRMMNCAMSLFPLTSGGRLMRLWMPHTIITARPGGASRLNMLLFAILMTRDGALICWGKSSRSAVADGCM